MRVSFSSRLHRKNRGETRRHKRYTGGSDSAKDRHVRRSTLNAIARKNSRLSRGMVFGRKFPGMKLSKLSKYQRAVVQAMIDDEPSMKRIGKVYKTRATRADMERLAFPHDRYKYDTTGGYGKIVESNVDNLLRVILKNKGDYNKYKRTLDMNSSISSKIDKERVVKLLNFLMGTIANDNSLSNRFGVVGRNQLVEDNSLRTLNEVLNNQKDDEKKTNQENFPGSRLAGSPHSPELKARASDTNERYRRLRNSLRRMNAARKAAQKQKERTREYRQQFTKEIMNR